MASPSTGFEIKRDICEALCRSVTKPNMEELLEEMLASTSGLHDITIVQAWRAPKGRQEGFTVVAAIIGVEGVDTLAVAFRSTQGIADWLEYPLKWNKPSIPRDGENRKGDWKVFRVFQETLDAESLEFGAAEGYDWNTSGCLDADPWNDGLRQMIWQQLTNGNNVWLAGHSKGGGVATVAASRLLLGDSVDAKVLKDQLGSPEKTAGDQPLPPRLSVVTFNAPMAVNKALSMEYNTRLAEVPAEHLRFENTGDIIRHMPRSLFFRHVGESHDFWKDWEEDTSVVDNDVVGNGTVVAVAVPVGGHEKGPTVVDRVAAASGEMVAGATKMVVKGVGEAMADRAQMTVTGRVAVAGVRLLAKRAEERKTNHSLQSPSSPCVEGQGNEANAVAAVATVVPPEGSEKSDNIVDKVAAASGAVAGGAAKAVVQGAGKVAVFGAGKTAVGGKAMVKGAGKVVVAGAQKTKIGRFAGQGIRMLAQRAEERVSSHGLRPSRSPADKDAAPTDQDAASTDQDAASTEKDLALTEKDAAAKDA